VLLRRGKLSAWSILAAIRENPDLLRWSQRRRGLGIELVDDAIRLDTAWREGRAQLGELQRQRNAISQRIAKVKMPKERQQLIAESKNLGDRVSAEESRIADLEKERIKVLRQIPNITHESVIDGKDETEDQVVKCVGKARVWRQHLDQFLADTKSVNVEYEVTDAQPAHHFEIADRTGLVDVERAAKVAGARFYYLLSDLVWVDLALALHALDSISKFGFTPLIPPHLMNLAAYSGVIDISAFADALYKLENEDLYLIATSEHPIAARYMNEVLETDELPLLIAGYSPCYRKEAGAHSKDTKGIFRVHQFSKVEQFVFCLPEESWTWIEKMIGFAEAVWKPLEIPFRIVSLCSGNLGKVAAKTYDIEAWMPGQGKYREMVSCSNCTDYQAYRLDIRYAQKRGHPTEGFVHTLNSTVVATTRAITAILENNVQPDGQILIPKPLLKYLKSIETAPDKYIVPMHLRKRSEWTRT
jgi:seryl-tRNA synthetase